MSDSAELRAQHAALTNGLGLADVSGRTVLEIRGSERASFLHSFCTNDIKRLQFGDGCEAFITSSQGKTLGHVVVWCDERRLLLETSPNQAPSLVAHFNRYVISEDVQFADHSAEWGMLLLAGKGVPEWLAIMHDSLKGIVAREAAVSCTPCVFMTYPIFICRTPLLGPNCLQILCDRSDLPPIRDSLCDQALLCSSEAVETVRIESGFPLFGRDMTDDNLPQEVGRDAQAISFTKGCYLGQETVARIDALGHVNKKLVGLRFNAEQPPLPGTPLLAGDKVVGRVTSAEWSPALDAPLALGYVRTAHGRAGSQLSSPVGAVEVVALPLTTR